MEIEIRDVQGKGKGIFARTSFERMSVVMDFNGPKGPMSSMDPEHISRDHVLQIGEGIFIGASGGPDDFVNHSCDPNCFVRVDGTGAQLVARKDIAYGEELTFDYSLTCTDESWSMECGCESPSCRNRIGTYKGLPEGRRYEYEREGIVPAYALRSAT